ncbi:MAG: S9 family peptidase [Bacteroidia bacterium]|nr:S9 family peptidase [Bacteroidia bacterium]
MKKLFAIFILYIITSYAGLLAQSKKLTLDDIYVKGIFTAKNVTGIKSLNDGEHFCKLENKSKITKYNLRTGQKTADIFDIEKVNPAMVSTIEDFEFNSNETIILLTTEKESIYRYSYKANYYYYDIKADILKPLCQKGKQQLACFSPKGTEIAYIRDNNIYIRFLLYDKESQVTIDGKENEILNGIPDWVYEEEFGFTKAFEWSPDGNYLAYYKFDVTKVKNYDLIYYSDRYPTKTTYKYPKPGEANSTVSIRVYNLQNKGTKIMNTGMEDDRYLPRIKWTTVPAQLAILGMNRLQNKLEIMIADGTNGISNVIYTEESEQYIEINYDLFFLNDNTFLITSEKDRHNHIYQYDLTGKLVRQITDGNWDVIKIAKVDEKSGLIYFISTEVSSLERHLYSIDFKGKNKIKLTERSGDNNIEICSGFKYFINRNTTANTPLYVSLNGINGKEIRILEANDTLNMRIKEYSFVSKEFITVKSDNEELNAWMLKPPDFEQSKKYPVLMYVYGGPGSQTVLNSWSHDIIWYQYLAQNGYIIVSVDGRGTGGRGEKFKKMIYKQLGNYEIIDQINAAKFLGELPYIDASRIGIWGWSYGGYVAAMCLFKGADIFKAAISVAPVTDWKFYDNIYTERFMQRPEDNPDGYDNGSLLKYVENLKGKFLLVHGTADDNVHFQNSMELAGELISANKQFDVFFYPNSNHGMNGKNARWHLYEKMSNFIFNNL